MVKEASRWRVIAQTVRADIAGAGLEAGARLPSESALAARFAVNRHTVRQALQSLAEEGVITIRRGAGSFVTGRVIDYPLSAHTRFTEIMVGQGRDASGEVIDWREEAAPPPVAKALNLHGNAKVTSLRRICRADDAVIGLGWHRVPLRRFPDFGRRAAVAGGITAAFRFFGVDDYQRAYTRISARLLSRTEARMLRAPAGGAVMVTEYVNRDAAGAAIEFGETLFLPERVRLLVGGNSAAD
ncbi:MAG: phosphonate metabolism transcriptional regulator PhnF [Pseudomonadota bacterium]|nr:phosphonate metabolism transcriptional regulator PhnF [Pseudomonadota bacterium]